MNKKFISLFLALIMVLGTFTSVFAEEVKVEEVEVPKITENDKKIQWLQDTKVVEGRKFLKDGKEATDLALDSNITRAEVTKLLIWALGNQDLASKVASVKIYTDVEADHWANGFIIVGSTTPSKHNPCFMIVGYPDGSFKPENDVTYAELAKMLVVLVKKDLTKDMEKTAIWPSSWLTWAAELGILEGVSYADANKAAPRKDAFVMVYNALYQLKTLKKTLANEELGIISGLTNGKLTINQGEKAKTFNVVGGTTLLVQHSPSNVSRTVDGRYYAYAVNTLANPSFYYGSLVRVLSDKDGNATHILVLGNPVELALTNDPNNGGNNGIPVKNDRWDGVADWTVETSYNSHLDDNEETVYTDGVLAKIGFKDGAAETLAFVNRADNDRVIVDLGLNSKTQYFVADVDKGQLTKVDTLGQAIEIVGYDRVNGYIDAVYAGFDTEGGAERWETSRNTALREYNEAKVVVFNKVSKDNTGEGTYRVKVDTDLTADYVAVLENTKGEVKFDSSRFNNIFPLPKETKYDVLKITNSLVNGRNYVRLIDHSNTDDFPIVRVRTIDGRTLVVDGAYGETARLQLASDAKIFREGELKEGVLIQFRTEAKNVLTNDVNKNNVLSIVSVLPEAYDLNIKGVQGSLKRVVEGNQENQQYGRLIRFDKDDVRGDMVAFYVGRDLYNAKASTDRRDFVISRSNVKLIEDFFVEFPNTDKVLRFKTQPGVNSEVRAYDFEVLWDPNNDGHGDWKLIDEVGVLPLTPLEPAQPITPNPAP